MLHPELVDALRQAKHKATRPADLVVKAVPNMMALRADLKLAGIDPGNAATRFVDFHALRMTLSTMMAAGDMSQRSRQAHMRHTDPRLTENTYMDEALLPIASELAALPAIVGRNCHESQAVNPSEAAQNMHETRGAEGHFEAKAGMDDSAELDPIFEIVVEEDPRQVLDLARDGTNEQGHASSDAWPLKKRVMGLEPTTFTLAKRCLV